MRIFWTWLVCLIVVSTVTIAWYITTPIALKIIRGSDEVIDDLNVGTTGQAQTFIILEYAVMWWGPVVDIFLIGWAIISSQVRDVESERYYG